MALWSLAAPASTVNENAQLQLERVPMATYEVFGLLGNRIRACVDNWLLVTPDKNPGLLDMFANREQNVSGEDENDSHQLVPFAGEYVGKYLISAVQIMRMSEDPRLRDTLSDVVERLLILQTDDGYLGPWPEKEQLLGHWDLWGNYHVMLGLILWYEQTGDERALDAVRKAADLVCRTFLDTGHRVLDVGEPDKNMAIMHILAILNQKTGEPRYLQMAMEVLKDFEKSGDYYRDGLASVEFFQTSKPRWESLHAIQGLVELYRITGRVDFKRAFLHHWASIRRFDMRNTGGFSSGEKATGDPFADAPIETCCVIAWQAVMIDALRLTGEATIADDIELATFNAVAGAQHPSGKWCTYDAAMNKAQGIRLPFHEQHAWQSRPNAPLLGCCPVNSPRGFGVLSEWGIMRNSEGLTVNFYGPMRAKLTLDDGSLVEIEQITDYPLGDTVRLKIVITEPKEFMLALRIPEWSKTTDVFLNGESTATPRPGDYFKINRTWRVGDEIILRLDLAIRYESGDLEQAGNVSLYRGPILLCKDDRFNRRGTAKIDVANLAEAKLKDPNDLDVGTSLQYLPWLVVELHTIEGKLVHLTDFANAGLDDRGYHSWLPAIHARPPKPVASLPADGATIITDTITFRWRTPADSITETCQYTVEISDSSAFQQTVLSLDSDGNDSVTISGESAHLLRPKKVYYWKVVARDQFGKAESISPYKQFTVDRTSAGQINALSQ